MKRFVICLDGTWNNASREVQRVDGSRVYRPTNVLKLARATRLRAADGVTQITYYDAGVGSMNRAPDFGSRVIRWADNTLGGGWGGGFDVNIEEAYTFLANNYTDGDEIFIFGFSRGASQARSLVRLIEWFGGFPTKNDVYYMPRIVNRYLKRQGEPQSPTLWEELNARREKKRRRLLNPIIPPNIVFLGVWDTVLALGSRIRAGRRTTAKKNRFHTPNQAPAIVRHIRHAIAIDEKRHDFQPEIFEEPSAHPSLEQRWFAGVHSNVGGGLKSDGLANCALRWMVQEACAVGLDVRDDFLKFYGEFPLDRIPPQKFTFKLGDTLLRPLRGFHGVRELSGANVTLDDTVVRRFNADPAQDENFEGPYRPENLLRYFARHREFDDQLAAHALTAVERARSG